MKKLISIVLTSISLLTTLSAETTQTEQTLVLLKPDCIQQNLVGEVLKRYNDGGLSIVGIKMIQLTEEIVDDHYSHHLDKPFFSRLRTFMKKAPVIAVILQGENAIKRTREINGPTDSRKAPKGTIRGDYGVDNMFNVVHASDSPESALVEINRFFKPEEVFEISSSK